ncbi:MAG: hypothetical protein CR993_08230 [Rhodobacterales bacterium]|nr:MAG: hypothetical protein CR993_08230 [Rhodobacterales bacterium]
MSGFCRVTNGFAIRRAFLWRNVLNEPHCVGCLKSVIARLKPQSIALMMLQLRPSPLSCRRTFPQKYESSFWRITA